MLTKARKPGRKEAAWVVVGWRSGRPCELGREQSWDEADTVRSSSAQARFDRVSIEDERSWERFRPEPAADADRGAAA